MCLIDMQFQNLFHFSRTDLYSLACRLFFSPPANTFATLLKSTERCSAVLLRGWGEFRTAAEITQHLDCRIYLSFLSPITINE